MLELYAEMPGPPTFSLRCYLIPKYNQKRLFLGIGDLRQGWNHVTIIFDADNKHNNLSNHSPLNQDCY